MQQHHLIIFVNPHPTDQPFICKSFNDENGLVYALEHLPEGTVRNVPLREPADIKALTGAEMVALCNHLRPGKPIKLFQSKEAGCARIWALLTTMKDPGDQMQDDEKTLTDGEQSSAPASTDTGDTPATQEEDPTMARTATAAKTTRGVRVKKEKAPRVPRAKRTRDGRAKPGDEGTMAIQPNGVPAKVLAKMDGTKTFNQIAGQLGLEEKTLKGILARLRVWKLINHTVDEETKRLTAVYPKGKSLEDYVGAKE
jgi:hypothetical protein